MRSDACPSHQALEDFFGREMFGCDFSCGAAIAFVIAFDFVNCRKDVVHSLKAKKAFAGRQKVSECCVLIDYGPACREIAGAAITEPTAAKANVLIFGDNEFAA
jgi:hypothetical protein